MCIILATSVRIMMRTENKKSGIKRGRKVERKRKEKRNKMREKNSLYSAVTILAFQKALCHYSNWENTKGMKIY